MTRILLTGGFGFLGGHLVEALRAIPGVALRVTDGRPSLPTQQVPGVDYVGGVDILDPDGMFAALDGIDVVIHLAGLVSFRRRDKAALFRVNRDGTRIVAEACARRGVRRLVHVSSVAAVGFNDDPVTPADENLTFDWSKAESKEYMMSKHAAELALAEIRGLNVVRANPGFLYGAGERTSLNTFRSIQKGRLPLVPPGGTNVVDVRDVAQGLAQLALTEAPGVDGERFILGGYNLTFLEVAHCMAAVVGERVNPWVLPRWTRGIIRGAFEITERLPGSSLTADLADSGYLFRYFSSAKAEQRVGWRAQYSIEQMLEATARAFVAAGQLADFPPATTQAAWPAVAAARRD